MIIRPIKYGEIAFCEDLVMQNWGPEPADRCHMQAVEHFKGGDYAPTFCIATLDDGMSPLGFAAYQPSMKMKGSFDFIWIAVHRQYQTGGVGKALTEWRIKEIKKRGGTMIELVTQKPDYFSKFGFIKLRHLDNEWYLMLRQLGRVDI